MALDFPELERPANATSRPVSAGNWVAFWALLRKSGLRVNAMMIASSYVAAMLGSSGLVYNLSPFAR
jgi:hypothetical protein